MRVPSDSAFEVHVLRPEETRELRHRVLWPHKASAQACVIDVDAADHAIHLGVFMAEREPWGVCLDGREGALVGVCSLFEQPCTRCAVPWREEDALRLRVMGTLPEVRGQGAGAALIARAAEEVVGRGKSVLWCDAREVAFGFYERLGFGFMNEMYELPDVGPHRTMALVLSSPRN